MFKSLSVIQNVLSDNTMKIDRMIQMLFNLMSRSNVIIILYCIFCTCIFSFQIPNTLTTGGYIGVRLILSTENCSRGSAEVFMFPSLDINNLAT